MGEEKRWDGKEGIEQLPPRLELGQLWSTGQEGGCTWEVPASM